MNRSNRRVAGALAAGALAAGAVFAATGAATPPSGPSLTAVPAANTKSPGFAPSSKLSPELRQMVVAQGSDKLENPTAAVSYYGYDNDVLTASGEPQMLPTPTSPTEAHKTEPDKNTYLVFDPGLAGADTGYDYGTHFLFQGHEGGTPGYLTRINLDADPAHRVTLLGTTDSDGHALPDFDGSTWDPWAKKLLFTAEGSLGGGVWSADPGLPSTIDNLTGSLGQGGYEGIQDDSDGNIWIVEDSGGTNKPGTVAKRPNSFLYRFVPRDPGDLRHGKLQALQVLAADGHPITFESQELLNNDDQKALHSYGNSFATRWVTIHDTAVSTTPFSANAAAKANHATPFKRPENGLFRPDGKFAEFYFDETGDTNATSPENDTAGGWGTIQKLTQRDPSADTGTLTLFYKSDQAHAGLDNIAFLSRDAVTFVQDAGDTLHGQANALDSAFVWDVTVDYSNASNQPVRWLAEGRDASATIDSANGGFGKNDSDNEITGAHVSDGDPTKEGILGAHSPNLADPHWRWFYTQQHGDNPTYEVVLNR
jgi:hypothetical protein